MMILPIGNTRKKILVLKSDTKGFTFVEVMVALVILSVGIVAILKSFIVSLDQLSYLTNRFYATTLLDNRVAQMERTLIAYNTLSLDELALTETVRVGSKKIDFKQQVTIEEVKNFPELFELNVTVSWKENNRDIKLARACYLTKVGH